MKLNEFDIEIYNLSDKKHEFQFSIDSSFFTLFDYGLVKKGNITVHLSIDKSVSLLKMEFTLGGSVELTCDRSLENFDYNFDSKHSLIIKFGEEQKEISEDVIVLPYNTVKINVAEYILEFINLAVPYKKIHPKFQNDETDDNDFNGKVVWRSNQNNEDKPKEMDPRWQILKDINNN